MATASRRGKEIMGERDRGWDAIDYRNLDRLIPDPA
jgi:hypothetical protein